MVSIRFQNPTQGPLITISFGDSDGVALAFVPAVLDCAPKVAATATTVGASAFAPVIAVSAIMAGDSSPRAQPLRGLSRFASAVVPDGVQATSDASPVGPAPVDLPGEPTESTTTAMAIDKMDWAALLAASPDEFFRLAYKRIAEIKQEVLRRLDRGETPESIIAWLRSEVEPEVDRMEEPMQTLPNDLFFAIKHDFGHMLQDIVMMIPIYLGENDVVSAREFCRTDLQSMEALISHLRLTFMGRAIIGKGDGLVDLEINSPEEAQQVLRILENLVRNAADHPRDGKIPVVMIERDGNCLIVRDTASGMDAATVQKIRDGVRIHDGKEVTSGNHGYGWQSIREVSDQLGIKWEIESQPGKGTTVTLTVPDGFFVPL